MQDLTGPPAVPALSTAPGALASRGPAPAFHDGHLHPERTEGVRGTAPTLLARGRQKAGDTLSRKPPFRLK